MSLIKILLSGNKNFELRNDFRLESFLDFFRRKLNSNYSHYLNFIAPNEKLIRFLSRSKNLRAYTSFLRNIIRNLKQKIKLFF